MGEYRINQWLQVSTMEPVFGIQKRVAPRKWMNCCEGKKPLFFKSKQEAKNYVKTLEE